MKQQLTDEELRQRLAFLSQTEHQTLLKIISPAERTRILQTAFPPKSPSPTDNTFVQWPPSGDAHFERRLCHAQ